MSSQDSEFPRRARFREQNNNWRGGRLIASNGYVIVRVGVGHHLADVRGYAYEHRVVAEKSIGRRLEKGEMVHHINGVKTDNRPENLQVVRNNAEHLFHHRRGDRGLRRPGEENPDIPCACGCGEKFPRYDECGRPRLFKSGHNRNPDNLRSVIRYFLEWIPEPRTAEFIAGFLSVDRRSVANALSSMKRKNEVEKHGNEWRLSNGQV